MKPKYPTIRTERLVLQPLEESDAGALFNIYQTEGVLRYFPNPNPPRMETVERFICGQLAHWEEHGYGDWGILLPGEDSLIGWAGLQYLHELDETEVGFLLDRPYWGRGLATEAALASLRFGFEHFSLDHMIALVHPENHASIRVIEKCGMRRVDCRSLWGIELWRYQIDRDHF